MSVRYEWADDSHQVMKIYLERPWSWEQYQEVVATVMPMIQALNHPVATIVDVSRIGMFPKDGNVLQNLLDVDKNMPENIFASVIVGAPYTVMVFINLLTKLRPRAKRMALFTKTQAEAKEAIHARHREMYPKPV